MRSYRGLLIGVLIAGICCEAQVLAQTSQATRDLAAKGLVTYSPPSANPPTAMASDQVMGSTTANHAEISMVAIPRGGNCNGRTSKTTTWRLFSSVAREVHQLNAFGTEAYVKQELNDDLTQKGSFSDAAPQVNQALAGKTLYPVSDNQFIRLSSGHLLAVRNTFIESFSAPWWNGTSGGRVGTLIVKSTDCGDNWEYVGLLDPKDITLTYNNKSYTGPAAYPQKDWLNQANKTTQFIQGGWDRQEVYADPWDGQTVYLALWGGGNDDRTNNLAPANSAIPSVVNAMVFASADGGKSWGSQPIKMFNSNPVPYVMTSTRPKQVFLFNCVGGTPTLHLIRNGNYIAAEPVFYGDASKPENACANTLGSDLTKPMTNPGYLSRVQRDVSISRVGGHDDEDIIRIVYPSMVNGRRVARVIVVRAMRTMFATSAFVVSKLYEKTIVAEDPKGSVIYPTFIEADRVDLPKTSPNNTAVLYWYETHQTPTHVGQTPQVKLFTRYAVFKEDGNGAGGTLSAAQDLSLTNGKRRYWSPANSDFIGDYMRGAFAYDGKLRFVAQWPERQPGENLRIRYNIITIEP